MNGQTHSAHLRIWCTMLRTLDLNNAGIGALVGTT